MNVKLPRQVSAETFQRFLDDKETWRNEGIFIDDSVDEAYWDSLFDPSGKIRPNHLTVELKRVQGYLDWQGDGDRPSDMPETLLALFKSWWKRQTTEDLVFTVPKEKVEAVKAAVAAILK